MTSLEHDTPVEENVFVPQSVICPGCGQSYHQTTPLYDSERPANGSMFELLPQYGLRGANWTSFPNDSAIRDGDLICPGCGAPYTNGGSRVRLREVALDKARQLHLEQEAALSDPEVVEHRENTIELVGLAEEITQKDDENASEVVEIAQNTPEVVENGSVEVETAPEVAETLVIEEEVVEQPAQAVSDIDIISDALSGEPVEGKSKKRKGITIGGSS